MKVKAKQYLQQIRSIDIKIRNKASEMELLTNSSESVTKRLSDEINRLLDERESIIGTVELLPPIECNFLLDKYVYGKSMKEIAIENDRSYSWATTTHDNAKKRLGVILEGRKENA